ncbi:MAG: DUF2721 domain-containing protein [Acidobacteria bacterium]|nr:DUF2721 domain-containing protein [Acidobacteriota bacterium]
MKSSIANLDSVLGVLSAMITPAVLILACGSLILTTSTRLTRVIDRVREMLMDLEQSVNDAASHDKRQLYLRQLDRSAQRARMLQKVLARFYAALAMFVTTSVAIGIVALLGLTFAWVALVFGFIGSGLMFSASILLIWESRLALAGTYEEMDFTRKVAERHR